MSNEEKTNDYENFEKGMIYMKILKKGRVVGKRGEEETKSMPHAPVQSLCYAKSDIHKINKNPKGVKKSASIYVGINYLLFICFYGDLFNAFLMKIPFRNIHNAIVQLLLFLT